MRRHICSRSGVLAVVLLGLLASWGHAQAEVEYRQPNLVLSDERLVVKEGERGNFSVGLDAPPADSIEVKIKVLQMGGIEPSDVRVDGREELDLTFTPDNWKDQIINVSALEDTDTDSDRARISLSASGAEMHRNKRGVVHVVVADSTTLWTEWIRVEGGLDELHPIFPLVIAFPLMLVVFFTALIIDITGRNRAAVEGDVVTVDAQQPANLTASAPAGIPARASANAPAGIPARTPPKAPASPPAADGDTDAKLKELQNQLAQANALLEQQRYGPKNSPASSSSPEELLVKFAALHAYTLKRLPAEDEAESKDLKNILLRLENTLEDQGVKIRGEDLEGQPYDKLGDLCADNPKVIGNKDPKKSFHVAEVLSPGYLLQTPAGEKVILSARVAVYSEV
ncbi:MAG: hypothetical protein ISN29_02240 [Gammaproteobacteria bacterium AqS3]|nr:hypothetical protein [Gammaproteobacteria bacterium AqS3]